LKIFPKPKTGGSSKKKLNPINPDPMVLAKTKNQPNTISNDKW
jgi:hypothetical protein